MNAIKMTSILTYSDCVYLFFTLQREMIQYSTVAYKHFKLNVTQQMISLLN